MSKISYKKYDENPRNSFGNKGNLKFVIQTLKSFLEKREEKMKIRFS